MHRALKIAGASVLALVLVVGVFGAFARPKVRRITTVAGRNFDLLSDVVTSDGHYYIRYLAADSDLESAELAARDLMTEVTRNPRAAQLHTLTVQRVWRLGVGIFSVNMSAAYVFERQGNEWVRAGKEALRESIEHQGARQLRNLGPERQPVADGGAQ